MPNLSKSRIIAFRQCPKRLWLEIHKPELRDDSASEMVFSIGKQVGEIARGIYDPENTGITIDIGELGHSEALAISARLLAEARHPLFEAGLSAANTLAYADVMLPDPSAGGMRWRMVEVKSSTRVKDYHRDDAALQSYLAHLAGVPLSTISVAYIDNTFVYQGDGDYRGLLHEEDLTEECRARHGVVAEWISQAHEVAVRDREPAASTGPHCSKPFGCPFVAHCSRGDNQPEFPLTSLPRLHPARRARIVDEGHEDLREVPDELLNAMQARVKQCSIAGEPYFDREGAAADLAPHGFPATFLDFETILFAVPIWKGTSPYQQIPFQYSLHRLEESGELTHKAFLDLSGNDPSEPFTRSLIEACGNNGPVFVYNATFEVRIMNDLARRFPAYEADLERIIERVVDLLPVANKRYYHPSLHGSWSIKAVLPALCPDLSYDDLDGVQDGSMAQTAYLEAISPETTALRKDEIRRQLDEYCKLDTLALVRIRQIFRGA